MLDPRASSNNSNRFWPMSEAHRRRVAVWCEGQDRVLRETGTIPRTSATSRSPRPTSVSSGESQIAVHRFSQDRIATCPIPASTTIETAARQTAIAVARTAPAAIDFPKLAKTHGVRALARLDSQRLRSHGFAARRALGLGVLFAARFATGFALRFAGVALAGSGTGFCRLGVEASSAASDFGATAQ